MGSRQGFIRRMLAVAALVVVAAASGTAWGASAQSHAVGHDFVVRTGPELRLHGKTFHFAGTNNYYLPSSSRPMVDDELATAAAQGFDVVRTWGFLEQPKNGVQFQSWDSATGAPAFNDGPTGLEHLDYVIAKAGQLGLRLVIPFTNNWGDFGGMDQYVNWRADSTGSTGPRFHDSFYTDPVIRQWYKAYVDHLLNRVNTITGVRYRDDPTIMTWELANEPRCKGSGGYPQSDHCTTTTLTDWAGEMTSYLKTLDHKHLVSVGDEGFFCDGPDAPDWIDNCGEGVDSIALASLPDVDGMSYHLYPDGWGNRTAQWADDYITRHNVAAKKLGKAVMLGEFGWKDKATRNPVYQEWTNTFARTGGNGFLYWILSGSQDDGTLYPDYDGFTVYCPSPVCTTISNATTEIAYGQRSLPPVADHDTAITAANTPVTVQPAANDIAYRTKVRPAAVDLDPATAGRQTSATVPGGVFTADSAGAVTFTPQAGFAGKAAASYVIQDQAGRWS